jgi:BirA family biotin operon repressor/biotin-[acetyl-CoA-carboxylase] ligase
MMRTAISPRFAIKIRGLATRSAPAADNRVRPNGSQTSVLSEHDLVRALERLGRKAPVRFDEVTGSTQATALAMAAEGAPEWTLVAAGHQTAGRGRLGRAWHDDPGRALLCSVVLRPDLPANRGGLLTLLAGVALAGACTEVGRAAASCDWPNDVLVGGRKVAGVLAESAVAGDRLEHVVLGFGVNLGNPPPGLPDAGGVEAEAPELLEAFLLAFAQGYGRGGAGLGESVLASYRNHCSTIGRRVRGRATDGVLVEGEAVSVDELGGLVVRVAEGTRVIRFGTVESLE